MGIALPALGHAIVSGLGTAAEQRERADRQAKEAQEQEYRRQQLLLQLKQLAELKRQHDLQYGEQTITLPDGRVVKGPRNVVPSIISGLMGQDKGLTQEQMIFGAGMGERMTSPKAMDVAGREAAATQKAWGAAPDSEKAKERAIAGAPISPLTVDLPQGVRLPASVFEKMQTQRTEAQKQQVTTEREDQKRASDAILQREYNRIMADRKTPHHAALAMASEKAHQETGIWPSSQYLPSATKAEYPSLEQSVTQVLQKPQAQWTPEDTRQVDIWMSTKEKPERDTLWTVIKQAEAGEPQAHRMLELYRNATVKEEQDILMRSMQIVLAAGGAEKQRRSYLQDIRKKPEEIESDMAAIAVQMARGTGNPQIVTMVSAMVGQGMPPLRGVPPPPELPGAPAPAPGAGVSPPAAPAPPAAPLGRAAPPAPTPPGLPKGTAYQERPPAAMYPGKLLYYYDEYGKLKRERSDGRTWVPIP